MFKGPIKLDPNPVSPLREIPASCLDRREGHVVLLETLLKAHATAPFLIPHPTIPEAHVLPPRPAKSIDFKQYKLVPLGGLEDKLFLALHEPRDAQEVRQSSTQSKCLNCDIESNIQHARTAFDKSRTSWISSRYHCREY